VLERVICAGQHPAFQREGRVKEERVSKKKRGEGGKEK